MGIGLGILLIVLGAVFTWVIEIQIPGINQYLLGIILMVAGLAVVILSFVLGSLRGRSTSVSTTDVAGNQAVTETRSASNQTEI